MTLSVLLVEDDDDLRAFLQGQLEGRGLQVRAVPSARAGIAHLGAAHVDVLLTDLHTGEGSSLELIQILMRNQPSATAILMSGCLPPHIEREAIQLGACAVLHKPFSVRKLHHILFGQTPA